MNPYNIEGHKDLARDPHTGTIINVNSLDYQHYIASRSAKDLKNKNPYNTYVNFGLPPTPISLTSHSSIKAALNPKDGKNLYFVAKGNNQHHFTTNERDHINAKNKFLKEVWDKY